MQTGSHLAEGTVVAGDFTVVRRLGSGGMGSVYVAEQKSTGKLRALKVMHPEIAPNADLQRRFEQEAKVGSRIKSGHVVEVVAAGFDAALGLPYLVMELLDGTDLHAYVRERGALPPAEVSRIFEQLCHGVAAAHAAGIVHRDLKPENIFLARPNQAGTGATVVVKVLDFGIAKLASVVTSDASATAAMGSPLWMAPEQTAPGPVTPAADVWALGLLAYFLLTGRPFWRAAGLAGSTTTQLLREIVLDPIPPASERGGDLIPRGFDGWFARAVARDPAVRFPDAGALWTAMQGVLPLPAVGGHLSFRPPSPATAEALAATAADPSAFRSAASGAANETPLAVAGATPAPSGTRAGKSARPTLAVTTAVGLALAGLLMGVGVARRPESSKRVVVTTAGKRVAVGRSGPRAAAAADPDDPDDPDETDEQQKPPPPTPPMADGFSDPDDGARRSAGNFVPPMTAVEGHHVRLFTRLFSNSGNVSDAVLRGGVDWSSWQYLRCYERAFSAARQLPEGAVIVSFDVIDQLPRHAARESSTFASKDMDDCVVGTLSGHTLNAAGSAGAGHVVYGFKFVVVD